MSTAVEPLRLAEPQEAGPLADFLERLLRYDRAAAVRLQTAGTTLAVFARLPLGQSGPLVVRTARLAQPLPLDVTVSAGQWLDALSRDAEAASGEAAGREAASGEAAGGEATSGDATHGGVTARDISLPPAITGPSWAGLLPPRSGWEHVEDLATAPLAAAVAAAIVEFRKAAEAAQGGDALAEAIWSRRVHPSGLTIRALHAAHLTGLLRQSPQLALHRHPSWLRLTAPRGSVAIRRSTPGLGLTLTPS